jgi:uncharacterized protein YehS (DUF1456 family)
MKKKLNPCSFTIVICLINMSLISCSDQNRVTIADTYPHVINIEEGFKNVSQIKLSEIADSISYVILSNDTQGPIGDVGNIQLTNSNIYLRKRSSFILRFDRAGKFLNSFGNIGRGPGNICQGVSLQ